MFVFTQVEASLDFEGLYFHFLDLAGLCVCFSPDLQIVLMVYDDIIICLKSGIKKFISILSSFYFPFHIWLCA